MARQKNVNQWLDRHRAPDTIKLSFRNIMYAPNKETLDLELKEIRRLCQPHEKVKKYLETYYLHRVCQWALCYRIGAGFSTSAYVESFHRTLKRYHMDSHAGMRVDEFFDSLCDYIDQDRIRRYVDDIKGVPSSRIRELADHHRACAAQMDNYEFAFESPDRWLCTKILDPECTYVIQQRECDTANCLVHCPGCEVSVCVHSLRCDCYAAVGGFKSCKHVHILSVKALRKEFPQPPKNVPSIMGVSASSSCLLSTSFTSGTAAREETDWEDAAHSRDLRSAEEQSSPLLIAKNKQSETLEKSASRVATAVKTELSRVNSAVGQLSNGPATEILPALKRLACFAEQLVLSRNIKIQPKTTVLSKPKGKNSRLRKQARKFKKSRKSVKKTAKHHQA